MALGVEPGWTQGESASHRMNSDDVRVSISICAGYGLRSTLREWRNAPDIQTARLQYSTLNGDSDERIPRIEDKATTSGHTMDAGVEQPAYGLGIGGNRIQVVLRGTWHSADWWAPARHQTRGFRSLQTLWKARHPRTPADWMQRRNGQMVVDKGKNCADASNGPAPHSRRLVSTAPFLILAATAT